MQFFREMVLEDKMWEKNKIKEFSYKDYLVFSVVIWHILLSYNLKIHKFSTTEKSLLEFDLNLKI